MHSTTHNWDYCYQNSDSKYFLWVGAYELTSANFIQKTLKIIEKIIVFVCRQVPYGISSVPNSENIDFISNAVYQNSEQTKTLKPKTEIIFDVPFTVFIQSRQEIKFIRFLLLRTIWDQLKAMDALAESIEKMPFYWRLFCKKVEKQNCNHPT